MTPGTLVTLGETMALLSSDRIGSLAYSSGAVFGVGGAESNVAIAATRLGTAVHWVGRVGSDSLGDRVIRELRGEGVHVHVHRDESAPTGLMLKERPTVDRTSIHYYRAGSAGSRLSASDIPAAVWERAAVLHVTGITLALSSSASDAVHAAVRRARACGAVVSFDVNHRDRLWSAALAGGAYRALAARADIVFAGESEGRLIFDADTPEEIARGIAKTGPGTVIIKRGEEGALALIDGELIAVDPVRVRAEDPVGAGDAFVGAYLAELIAGAPPMVRLRTAALAGAHACTVPGDWEGDPTRQQLRQLASRTDSVER